MAFIFLQVFACQKWECASLEYDVCAEWDEKQVKINTNNCAWPKKCYLLGLELEKTWNVQGKLYCEDFLLKPSVPPINCHVRRAGYQYESRHPIKCYKNSQCVTSRGVVKNCVCSMDGNGYCELQEGDQELDEYAETCYGLTYDEAFAWYLYMDLFPLLHRVPKCAQGLFSDLQVLMKYSGMLGINYTNSFM